MFYKSPDKEKVALIAALYDCQAIAVEALERVAALELAAGGRLVAANTRHWSKPEQDADGDWFVRKPGTELECDTIGMLDCPVVETVEIPDEDTP